MALPSAAIISYHFFRDFRTRHSTPHISGTKRGFSKQKFQRHSTICPLKVDLHSVTFDPETAEIRLGDPLAMLVQLRSVTDRHTDTRRQQIPR